MSNELTLSDHWFITFFVIESSRIITEDRNLRKTNCGWCKTDLEEATKNLVGKFSSIIDLELTVDQLQHTVLLSYYQNYLSVSINLLRLVPWWSEELSIFTENIGSPLIEQKKCSDSDLNRVALTDYNKSVQDTKRNSWR